MSSEYSTFLHDKPVKGQTEALSIGHSALVKLTIEGTDGRHDNREQILLFIKASRLMEMSLLFHRIAQELGALVPQPDTCCRDGFADSREWEDEQEDEWPI